MVPVYDEQNDEPLEQDHKRRRNSVRSLNGVRPERQDGEQQCRRDDRDGVRARQKRNGDPFESIAARKFFEKAIVNPGDFGIAGQARQASADDHGRDIASLYRDAVRAGGSGIGAHRANPEAKGGPGDDGPNGEGPGDRQEESRVQPRREQNQRQLRSVRDHVRLRKSARGLLQRPPPPCI